MMIKICLSASKRSDLNPRLDLKKKVNYVIKGIQLSVYK